MKKLFYLALSMLFLFSLSSCHQPDPIKICDPPSAMSIIEKGPQPLIIEANSFKEDNEDFPVNESGNPLDSSWQYQQYY